MTDEDVPRQLTQDVAGDLTEQLSRAGIEVHIPTKARAPRAAHMQFGESENAQITFLEVGFAPPHPPPRKTCRARQLFDVAGFGGTGAEGSVTLHLQDAYCDPGWVIEDEDAVWVVATPRSSQPVLLTHLLVLPSNFPGPFPPQDSNGLAVRFFTWNPTGQPVAASFTWRAIFNAYYPVQ